MGYNFRERMPELVGAPQAFALVNFPYQLDGISANIPNW